MADRMTPFRFDHAFRAPSVARVFEAYFDPDLTIEQDRRAEVATRETLELADAPGELRRVCKVAPRRRLPAIVRPFVRGDLSYVERLVWRKADDRMDLVIEPAILGGRVEITSIYRLIAAGAGVVQRTYEGEVSVELRLVGARVERAIIEDLGRTLVLAAACTQEWLDARSP
jgi:hypothetical protein